MRSLGPIACGITKVRETVSPGLTEALLERHPNSLKIRQNLRMINRELTTEVVPRCLKGRDSSSVNNSPPELKKLLLAGVHIGLLFLS
jgi:hypothetical protein